ncbi:MAG: SpoIIE family protein phosphatase [SAR324 cluster bacterium]|nr:SpoIIE family protein phosphatase [SAR324 cluster bacterium]
MNMRSKVLLVDDDPMELFVMESVLKGLDIEIVRVDSGEKAIEATMKQNFAVILLDVRMPDINGFEVAKVIQSSPNNQNLPIIFVTSFDEQKAVFAGYKSGAVDYIFKPFEPVILKSKVSVFIELEQKRLKLEQVNQQMIQELQQARRTQLSILPQRMPDNPYMKVHAMYKSVESVGGDFYNFIEFSDQRLGVVVADVTGHGVSAALISTMASGLVDSMAKESSSPAQLLLLLNELIYQRTSEESFITLVYAIIDPIDQSLIYASAGHRPIYIIRHATKTIDVLSKTDVILGVFSDDSDDHVQYTDTKVSFAVGDRIFLYTDGIVEANNSKGGWYGTERLKQRCSEWFEKPLDLFLDNIFSEVLSFSSNSRLDDDVTLLGIDIVATPHSLSPAQ